MKAIELIDLLMTSYNAKEVFSPKDLKDKLITYAVIQGTNILTIGSGDSNRLKTLMGNKGCHNKAPVIGLCYRLYPEKIRFFVCKYTPFDIRIGSIEERALQASFGTINIDGKISYPEAVKDLRCKLGIKEGNVDGILLDLMETHGDILNHALNTKSTADVVEKLFAGYWKKSKNC